MTSCSSGQGTTCFALINAGPSYDSWSDVGYWEQGPEEMEQTRLCI